jgi:hypothetical protein
MADAIEIVSRPTLAQRRSSGVRELRRSLRQSRQNSGKWSLTLLALVLTSVSTTLLDY